MPEPPAQPQGESDLIPYWQVIPSSLEAALKFVWKRHPDELAFWKAMLAAPADPLPRLVYADWLDEKGDPVAGTLREARPFRLHYLVNQSVTVSWELRNQRPAGWTLAVAELRTFAARGDVLLPEQVGHFDCLRLIGEGIPRASGPRRLQWEQHGLEVRVAMGYPAPPFLNYLLYRLAGLGNNHRT
jgi:uncharacterized protein (TIGR02996 family)